MNVSNKSTFLKKFTLKISIVFSQIFVCFLKCIQKNYSLYLWIYAYNQNLCVLKNLIRENIHLQYVGNSVKRLRFNDILPNYLFI